MAFRIPDLVRQVSATTGTGTYVLGAALPGFRACAGVLTAGDTMYYRAMLGTEWEIGLGTYNGTNLVRSSVLLSTNSNNAVNWGAGNKVIFSVAPEELISSFFRNTGGIINGDVTLNGSARQLIFDGPISSRSIRTKVNAVDRWNWIFGFGAEGAGNTGSDILLQSFTNAGALIGTKLQITRDGQVGINGVVRTDTPLAIRTIVNADPEGIFIQNQDNTANSVAGDIKFAGVSGAIRARLRAQRMASTNNGRMVISAYTGGTGADIASFNPDGTVTLPQQGSARVDAFPSGTRMLFQQSTAPLGWTKDVSLNDRALRVVSGSVNNGGSVAFSSAFTSRAVSGNVQAHVLTWNEMPEHSHSAWTDIMGAHSHIWNGLASSVVTTAAATGNISSGMGGASQIPYTDFSLSTNGAHAHNVGVGNAGGNWGHVHGLVMNNMDFSVAFTDVIICQKD